MMQGELRFEWNAPQVYGPEPRPQDDPFTQLGRFLELATGQSGRAQVEAEDERQVEGGRRLVSLLDLMDDPGIAALRQRATIGPDGEVNRYQGPGIGDVLSALQGYIQGGRYETPFADASLAERIQGGAVLPGGGMADVAQGGAALIRRAPEALSALSDNGLRGLLGLVSGGDNSALRAIAPTGDPGMDRMFRTLEADQVDEYLDIVNRMPEDKRGFITPYSREELVTKIEEGAAVRVNPEGVGYIIDHGDLQGVINASGRRGAGREAIDNAILNGAQTLDAFDGFLPDYYKQFGFQETGRMTFDPQYAPEAWDTARHGTPDVVQMRLGPHPDGIAPTTEGLAKFLRNVREGVENGLGPDAYRVLPEADTAGNAARATSVREWGVNRVNAMPEEQLSTIAEYINKGRRLEADTPSIRVASTGEKIPVADWYDMSAVRNRFHSVLGEEQGEMAYSALVAMFAVTSPRTKVADHAQATIGLFDALMNGRPLDEIMNTAEEVFGTIKPGKVGSNAGYSRQGGSLVRGVNRDGTLKGGSLANFLTNGVIDTQKVGSFFQNLMGNYVPLTVDSHNIRQLIGSMGYDLTDPAARREIIEVFGAGNAGKFAPFLQDTASVTVKGTKGQDIVLESAQEINTALSDLLYGRITNNSQYGAIEQVQNHLRETLISRGLIDANTSPAQFQARLWTGASEISAVAEESVPSAAQSIFNALEGYRALRSGQDGVEYTLDEIIQRLWTDGVGARNVFMEAAYEGGGFGLQGMTRADFDKMMRGVMRGNETVEREQEPEQGADPLEMLMSLMGGGGR